MIQASIDWRKPSDFVSKRWHAFHDTTSLCGDIMLASSDGIFRRRPPQNGRCGACLSKWRALQNEHSRNKS